MPFLIPAGVAAATTAATASAAAAATTATGVAAGAAASSTLIAAEAAATAATAAMAPAVGSTLASWLPTVLSVATSGGQLLSGISERMTAAAQARAEAKAMEQRARAAAQKEFQKGVDVVSKGHVVSGAAGIEPTTGSPLSMMLDNLQKAVSNSGDILYEGQLGASQRQAEARQYTNPWSMMGLGATVLSDFYKRSRYV